MAHIYIPKEMWEKQVFYLSIVDVRTDPPARVEEGAAYVVVDTSPRGFRLLRDWIKDNHKLYPNIYRAKVPYSYSHATPAEYALATSSEPIHSRARDMPFNGMQFELVVLGDMSELIGEWPFVHRGTFRDICGNAEFGEQMFTIPKLISGFSVIQELFLSTAFQHFTPYERCCFAAVRFDVNYSICRDQWTAIRTREEYIGIPTLPPGITPRDRAKRMVQAVCEGKTIPDNMVRKIQCTDLNGRVVNFTNEGDYVTSWVEEKAIRHLLQLRAQSRDPYIQARRVFVQSLVIRHNTTKVESDRLSFFNLSRRDKRLYVRNEFPDNPEYWEPLLNLTILDVGRELYEATDEHRETEGAKQGLYANILQDVYDEEIEEERSRRRGLPMEDAGDNAEDGDSSRVQSEAKSKKRRKKQKVTPSPIFPPDVPDRPRHY